jgi:hypothetical protein
MSDEVTGQDEACRRHDADVMLLMVTGGKTRQLILNGRVTILSACTLGVFRRWRR